MKGFVKCIRLWSIAACLILSCGVGFCDVTNAVDVPSSCPGADAWVQAHKLIAEKEAKPIIVASDAKLRNELAKMAQEDTSQRDALIKSQGNDPSEIQRMEASDAQHLAALHRLAPNGVLPDIHRIGTDGMSALMLLVQHANGDHAFQQAVLKNLNGLVQKGEVSGESYALLTDRVLMQNNEPQIYGTQMSVTNNVVHLYKVDAPSDLEMRRKSIGLMPLKDYECVISMSYKMPFDPSGANTTKASVAPSP